MKNDTIQLIDPSKDGISQREDDQGFAAALRLAIPAGLLLWGLIVTGVFRFVA